MKAVYLREGAEFSKLEKLSQMTKLNRSEIIRRIIQDLDLSPESVEKNFGIVSVYKENQVNA